MKTSGDCNLGTTTVEHFQTVERESRISWVMIAARTDASTDQDTSSKSSVDQKSRVNIHTIEYRSTLNNGWIPEHSVEFFTLFITDLHEKWRGLLEAAQEHQANNVRIHPKSLQIIGYFHQMTYTQILRFLNCSMNGS